MTEEAVAGCLSYEVLLDLLRKVIEPWGVKDAVNVIESGGRKVFAVLILMKEEKHIIEFMEHVGQTSLDSQMPFSKEVLENFLPREVAMEFEEEQWDFVAHVFQQQVFHQRLERRIRLPFIESRKLGWGGFSNVHQVVIPAGYHNFAGVDSSKVGNSHFVEL